MKKLISRTLLTALTCCLPIVLSAQTASNTSQQLAFAGLRSAGMQGQINAVKTDSAGNVYLLLNQKDGVRLLKTDISASTVQAQALLGAAGDIGVAMALDPAGNVYVTGITSSSTLVATAGAAFPSRTDASTQSFVAKFDSTLKPVFVTFAGGSKIAASAIAATADAVFITGVTYATNLPVTANGIQQAPATGSSGNGFVERFLSTGSALIYATYLTGAAGDTTPTAIAADAADHAYVAGATSATGYPTVLALVPNILSNPSGFLTKLTAAGDAFSFSTYIPGGGLTSLALDAAGTSLLASGSVALGQFPVSVVTVPIVQTPYQVLLRLPLDGSAVTSSTLLAPGSQSFVAPGSDESVWIDGTLAAPFTQALSPLAESGSIFAARVSAPTAGVPNTIDQTARFGGLPNTNATFSSLLALPTSIAVDPSGAPLIAGAVQPTASSSLLATETYDFPLRNAPTAAFPSTLTDARQTAATCNGSLCAGSAAYLARLNPSSNLPALAFAANDLPFLVLRNLGTAAAAGLQITSSAGTFTGNCGASLASGAQCNLLLSGGAATTLTATSTTGDTQTVTLPAYAATPPASTIVVSPHALDFGIRVFNSPAAARTLTVTNLGSTSQAFTSAIDSSSKTASPFTEFFSNCPLNGATTRKILAPGASCSILLTFTPDSGTANDGPRQANWSIGSRDVALSAWSQAAAVSASAPEIDFGTQSTNGIRVPRYLYLSNSSAGSAVHTSATLPANSPFTLTDNCPGSLTGFSVCRIRIDYLSPTAPSNDSATLNLNGGLQVLLTGQTLPPRGTTGSTVNPNLSVTPTTVTFPNAVPVTAVGSTQNVSVMNTGTTPFTLAITHSGDFTDVTSCGATLAGGATCAIALSFVPSQPGVRQGLLSVTAGAGTSPQLVALSGTGTAILPANSGSLDQGSDPIGQPSVRFYKIAQPFSSLTVSATGPYTVALIEDNGQGPGTPPASAYKATQTGSCRNCFLAINFIPAAAAAQPGSATFTSDPAGSPYTVALTGNGIAVTGLLLSPTAQDFGAVPVHSASGSVAFTVTNLVAGGTAINLSPPVITGDYALNTAPTGSAACGGALAYGSSCTSSLNFTPTATGTRPGTLTFTAGTSTASATLSGTGAADPGLAVSPLSLLFANVPGSTATQQTVTLTNTGTASVQIGPPTTATASFKAATACTALAPLSSCTVTVTFVPGTSNLADTLTISVTGGQTAIYTVALSGDFTAASSGLSLTPGVAEYGAQPVGTEGPARQFTLTNGTATALATTVGIPRQYILTSTPCSSLPAGASCSFSIAFAPLDNGDAPGTLYAQGVPADGYATRNTISYAEGYGTGSGALTITGGLLVNGGYSFGQVTSGQTASQVFTIANRNPAGSPPLTVRRVTSPPPFLSTTNCGATLAVSQSCTVTVIYTPSNQVGAGTSSPASTTDTGALTIESDASSSPDTVQLNGQAGAITVSSPANAAALATFTLSQGSLTFSSTAVGNASAPQTVTLTNTGNVALHLLALGSTADYTVTSTCGAINPGASCTLTVSSTPQTAGVHLASLEIATDSTTSLDFISLISTATPAALTLTPAALDFGSLNLGTSAGQPVQITNNSAAPVVLSSITGTGDYTAGGNCPAAGNSLAPGTSCTVQVTFSPTATGTRPGSLSVTSSASTLPLTAALTGNGIQSHLQVTPGSFSFGPLVLNASASQTLTVVNDGTALVNTLQFRIAGDFSITQPCPAAALAPGANCTVQITFSPTALGTRAGTLTLTSSDPSSPLTIPLTGTGIANGGFILTVDGGAASTVTVQSGKPATYHLAVTPTGSFSGSVVLTCTALAPVQFASCSLSPSSLTLTGAAQAATATINTITSDGGNALLEHGALHPGYRAEKLLCLLLPGLWAIYRGRRRFRSSLPLRLGLLLVGSMLLAAGCGSQGGDLNARYVAPGTYAYQVTASSTSGVQITQTITLNLTVTPR